MSVFNKIKIQLMPLLLSVYILFSTAGCGGGAGAEDIVKGNDDDINLAVDVISDGSISWGFSSAVQSGKFANGDSWVVGPVTITVITPSYNGKNHGFEVNPVSTVSQGFDERFSLFDPSLVPSLPYLAQPGESIVKSISIDPSNAHCRPCIQRVAVLTVLSEPPANNGATIFRPPYFGTEKPLYSTDDLNFSLLPGYVATASALTFDQVASQYQYVQLDHKIGWGARYMHPVESMPDYGADIALKNTRAGMTLMLQGTDAEKKQAVINYINNGIDIYHMMKGGVSWPSNGGHAAGRKLPAIMAAVLLENNTMKNDLTNISSATFGETGGVYHSSKADNGNGKVLWGQTTSTERRYWESFVLDNGSRTDRDPYQEIDGGRLIDYQICCTTIVWENIVTALELMPSLKPVFNFPNLKTYTDRWMASGFHTQPDSCAPPTGLCAGGSNAGASCTTANASTQCTGVGASCDLASSFNTDYGVTYGSDGNGDCIKDLDSSDGIGRFPQLHGTSAGTGYYGSAFAAEMKAAYVP